MDHEAFMKMIKVSSVNMYRLAYGILHSDADAQDAVGAAVLKAYENLGSLRNPDRFHAWIMQITANEARKLYRRSKKNLCMEQIQEMVPAFEDDHHELWDVVMKLDVSYREVIILYFYEQLTIKEISRVLRIAEGTVKSRLFRAKKLLKDML